MSSNYGYTFLADIYALVVDKALLGFIGGVVGNLGTLIGGMFGAAFGVYGVYFAYKTLLDNTNFPIMDCLKEFIRLGVVTMFALNTVYFMETVAPFVLSIGDELGKAALAGLSGTNFGKNPNFEAYQMLDAFFTNIASICTNIIEQHADGFFNFLPWLCIVVILVGAVPFAVTAFLTLISAQILTALLLCVGTLYISFAFFPSTRHWFHQWCGSALNYTLIAVVMPLMLALEMAILDAIKLTEVVQVCSHQSIASCGLIEKKELSLTQCLKLACTLWIFSALCSQIPSFVASISGGVGVQGMTAGSAIGAGRRIGGLAKSMGSPVLGAAKSGGKGAWSAGKWAADKAYGKAAEKGKVPPDIKAG